MANKNILPKEKHELLQHISSMQLRLNKMEDANVDLRAQIVKMELEKSAYDAEEFKQIQEKISQKDHRILELNDVILEKERQIIDLQEMCSEQGKVNQSKALAFGIVNKRLSELDSKQTRDVSTETIESSFPYECPPAAIGTSTSRSRSPRRNSPGRAVAQFRFSTANGSPPPLDPADGCSSYTTETQNVDDDTPKSKKFRKKVTFEDDGAEKVHNAPKQPTETTTSSSRKEISPSADYEELLTENDHLRQIISEMEKYQSNNSQQKMVKSESLLKLKANAQAKIKELEGIIAQNKLKHDADILELKAIIDQLNESREWILDENARIQEQMDTTKQKCEDLHEELDASLKTTDVFRKKLDETSHKLDGVVSELYLSRAQIQQVTDEKAILSSEIERLKEAIFAQDDFITLLEGDLIVYEAHVGILRDTLGASKKEDRQNIKSKAFHAKISALETEKQEIAKKNSEEKLRTKALTIKVRCLEEERDELKTKLRMYENLGAEQPIEKTQQKEHHSMPTTIDECDMQIDHLEHKLQAITKQNDNLIFERNNLEHQLDDVSNNLRCLLLSPADEKIPVDIDSKHNFTTYYSLIVKKFEEDAQTIQSLHTENDSLLEKFRIHEENFKTLSDSNEQIVKERDEIKCKLEALDGQYEIAIAKIEQSDRMIASFEQRNADLLHQLTEDKTRLATLIEEKQLLTEQKDGLDNHLQLLEEEKQNLINEKAAIESNYFSANEECITLSKTLAEQKKRLDKLIAILTEIVERFKMDTSFDDFSTDSIDKFIEQIGGSGSACEKKIKSKETSILANVQTQTEEKKTMNKVAQTFLQRCDAAIQMEKDFDDERHVVEQQSNSTVQTQTELIEMADKIVQNKIQQNDADVQTEQEVAKIAEPTTIDVTNVLIQTEDVQTQNKDAATQSEFDVPAADQILNENENQKNNQQQEEVSLFRQESHQLLLDCIQDREEFERHLGDNVQQLIELKTELENSVEVLKGEVWSLNAELKKRFNERECLKNRLDEFEKAIVLCKSQNEELRAGICRKDEEIQQLKHQLQRSIENGHHLEAKIETLNSLEEEKTRKIEALEASFYELKRQFLNECMVCKEELAELKQLMAQIGKEIPDRINCCLETASSAIQQYKASLLRQGQEGIHSQPPSPSSHCPNCFLQDNTKLAILAARLTTKSRDNEALLRENQELLLTNAHLQAELEQLAHMGSNNNGGATEVKEPNKEENEAREQPEADLEQNDQPEVGEVQSHEYVEDTKLYKEEEKEQPNEEQEDLNEALPCNENTTNENNPLEEKQNEIQEKEEEECEEEKEEMVEESNWNWGDEETVEDVDHTEEEGEEKEAEEEEAPETRQTKEGEANKNADDWNWDEGDEDQQEQEEEEAIADIPAGNEAAEKMEVAQNLDEWAWNEEQQDDAVEEPLHQLDAQRNSHQRTEEQKKPTDAKLPATTTTPSTSAVGGTTDVINRMLNKMLFDDW